MSNVVEMFGQLPTLMAPKVFTEHLPEKRRADIEWAFPTNVEPGIIPHGPFVMVQLRSVKRFSEGGIEIPDEARRFEKWETVASLVWAIGPMAYRDRDTLKPWPEGIWCKSGDFVLAPKMGGFRWEVRVPGRHERESALFAIVRDRDIWGQIVGDPLEQREYV
jgi:co-chaperonin GroES (HSP10)